MSVSQLSIVEGAPRSRSRDRRSLLRPLPVQEGGSKPSYGSLELPELIHRCFADRFTGTLQLHRGRLRGAVSWLDGRPCLLDGPVSEVGLLLFAAGVLDEIQYARALEIAVEARIVQGEAAVRLGCLSHDALRRLCRRQVQTSVLQFAGRAGQYRLVPTREQATWTTRHEVGPISLVFASLVVVSTAQLAYHYDRGAGRHVARGPNSDRYRRVIEAHPLGKVLASLAGRAQTLGQVVAESPAGLAETLRVLRALEILGCVSLGEMLAAGQPAESLEVHPRGLASSPPTPAPTPAPAAKESPRVARLRRLSTGPLPLLSGPRLAERIRSQHGRLARASHYELLDVHPEATAAEIQSAYHARVKELHRDSVAELGDPVLLEMARQITGRLLEAIQILRDDRHRHAYDVSTRDVGPDEQGGLDLVRAEADFHRGRVALEAGDLTKALAYLDRACAGDDHRPQYVAWRGWARFRAAVRAMDPEGMQRAHDEIKQALLEDRTLDDGFVLLGHCYLQTGNRESAIRFYRKALGLNRQNAEAIRGLQRLERETGPQDLKRSTGEILRSWL